MLVLLIIFMITAHVMESGIEINVPKTKSVQSTTKDLPIVSITKSREVYLGKDTVNFNRLAEEIRAKYPGQESVYLRADGETPFDPIAKVMSVLGTAKLDVSVVTQPDDRKRQRALKRGYKHGYRRTTHGRKAIRRLAGDARLC